MPCIETEPTERMKNERVKRPELLLTPSGERISTVEAWEARREEIERDWRSYLGSPPFASPPLDVRVEQEFDFPTYQSWLLRIRMEPDYYEQCYLMVPKKKAAEKLPAVVVFFYDVDTPAAHNLGSPRWKEDNHLREYGKHLVERGYVVLVQRWAFEGYLEVEEADRKAKGLANRYTPAVARHQRLFPGWKGLGRVIWDASRAVDYLHTLDFVDTQRIAAMGHSLGGKMAFYATAFDRRIAAGVGSDFGVGLPFSNWEAPWYLGPEVQEPDFPRDHHQLLAMIAPRPFLVIAGEDADGERSWKYLNSAREVYALYGAEKKLGMYNHGTGHTPTWDSLQAAYAWLDEQLGHRPLEQE